MRQPFEALAACLLIAAVALPFPALADDQDTIDYRQHIMNALDEQSAAIDQILQHKAPPDNLAIHAQIVAITAAMAKKAFAPKVLGGESKPAVWSNWADFSKRLDGLVAYTQGVAQAAKQGGTAAVGPALAASHPCQDCHAIYQQKKPVEVHADEIDAIAYRRHIMSTLNEQSAALGIILSGDAPDDNFAAHLEAIALGAKTASKAFEPKAQGGEAKPEVWTNWPDFSKRMNDFVQNSDRVAGLARDKGKDAAAAEILDALPCKSCHDIYRNEKK